MPNFSIKLLGHFSYLPSDTALVGLPWLEKSQVKKFNTKIFMVRLVQLSVDMNSVDKKLDSIVLNMWVI
ncbi:hypothetical protein B9J80_13950 [Vibrio sp. V12_P9A6T4]|nr:hypothetical protein B9J80_13950 [Vibrio sp. V12_P9A6T4]